MAQSAMLQVFRKELRETMRDKRVRSSAFVGPFLTVLMLMVLFGTIISSISKPSSFKFHVVRPKTENALVESLKEKKVTIVEIASLEAGRKLVQDGKASLVLQFEDDYNLRLARGEPTTIQAVFDSKEQRSQIAMGAIERSIAEANKQALAILLESKGVPPGLATPVKIKSDDVTRAKGASELLVGFLPYLIVMWAFFGGVSTASDIVAGEKERNTLETLLITPVSRTQIVLGKFLSLALICLLSSLSSLVAVLLAANLPLPGMDAMFKSGSGITPLAIGAIFLILLPTVTLFAGVLVAISTYAKDTREAQTHLNLANFAIIMPAVFSQVIGFTEYASAMWINFVPVLNTATTIRAALLGKLEFAAFASTFFTSLVLGAIGIWIAVRLFNREQVLTRT